MTKKDFISFIKTRGYYLEKKFSTYVNYKKDDHCLEINENFVSIYDNYYVKRTKTNRSIYNATDHKFSKKTIKLLYLLGML